MGTKWQFQLQIVASVAFNFLPAALFSVIFPVVMGVLLRLPQFIIELRRNKKWTFDWPKFLAVGLPTSLILILYIIYYLGIAPVLNTMFTSGSTLPTIAGIIFGYIVVDSLIKHE